MILFHPINDMKPKNLLFSGSRSEGRWRSTVLLKEKTDIRGVRRSFLCLVHRVRAWVHSFEECSAQRRQTWEYYFRFKRIPSFDRYIQSYVLCTFDINWDKILVHIAKAFERCKGREGKEKGKGFYVRNIMISNSTEFPVLKSSSISLPWTFRFKISEWRTCSLQAQRVYLRVD